MASVKVLLDTRRRKVSKTYPIVIRITHQRQSRNISTGHSIELKYWNAKNGAVKSSHKEAIDINSVIHEISTKVVKTIKELTEKGDFKLHMILDLYYGKQLPNNTTVIAHGQSIVTDLIELGKVGNAKVYENAINQFKLYFGELSYAKFNYETILEFERKLILKGLKTNSIAVYMRTLRSMYNKAIKLGIAKREDYPFDKYSVIHEKTAKRAISPELLHKVFKYPLKQNSAGWHWRNYFILIFNLIGINFTDLVTLRYSDIREGRVCFRRKKTGKLYNIKLTAEARRIIKLYDGQHSIYLLPVLPENLLTPVQQKKFISEKLKQCNKYLKRIGNAIGLPEPLTTYVSRHSWATIAKQQGISNEVIAEALGHEYGNKITGIYLDQFDLTVVDEANRIVTGAVK